MPLKDMIRQKVHTRNISVATYSIDDDQVLVEGTLQDDRLVEYYLISSRDRRPPGVIHQMTLRILVEAPEFIIRDIEVDMPGIPREECSETGSMMESIRGLSIAPGFTNRVKKLLGGSRGCAHLVNLLLAMAPAAVQGFWTHKAQKPLSVEDFNMREKMSRFLINTCWVWREDGPLVKDLKNRLAGSD